MKVQSLDHIHVYCRNAEASAAFYVRHFEAVEVIRNTDGGAIVSIFLALGGQILVLAPFPPGMAPSDPPAPGDGAFRNGFGVAHFGLRVDDVASATDELAAAGVRILGEPIDDSSGLLYAYAEAPDGVVLELTQYDIPAS